MSRPARSKDLAIAVFGSVVVSSLAVAVALLVAGPAAADSSNIDTIAAKYGVLNATANAATVHVVVGSTAFPNFTTGAVDNYYAMAHTHVDNSPFAEGTSSPFDTGPIGQTAAAGNFSQPQYADARWPGDSSSGSATFGNQGGPYAVAKASDYTATADCQEASASAGSSGVNAPKGFKSRLRVALAAWKAKWLAPLDLKKKIKLRIPLSSQKTSTLPITVPTVTLPSGLGGGGTTTDSSSTTSSTSQSTTSSTSTTPSSGPPENAAFASSAETTLDASKGLVTSGESSLGTVSIGGGQIVIKKIDVTASITNTGTPADTFSISIGSASIGGVPVTIDQDGVHVAGQGQNLPYQQADDALNSALKQAGVQLFTVVPEVTKSNGEETVIASGVHVQFVQPVDQSGVPAQNADHILGEVYVDSLATPAPPAPSLNLGGGLGSTPGAGSSAGGVTPGAGGTSSIAGGASSTYTSGGTSGTGTGSTGNTSQTTPTSLTSALSKPMWLLIVYLVWQALALATGASLWRWRTGGAS